MFSTATALAHEGRDVGDYNLVVSFISEPAVEGMLNGVLLSVSSLKDEGHSDTATDHADETSHEIDLVSHGGVFVGELDAGGQYEFTFSGDFEGMTVPFHAHPVETEGSIMIGTDNPVSDEVVVEIRESGFGPAMVMIQAGTTVRFENRMTDPTVVMSGLLGETVASSGGSIATDGVSGIRTLEVEVTHIASEVSQTMDFEEDFINPGQYKAEFIPTSPGPYRFRIFGEIEGQGIDETFESSNTTFDEVISASNLQFPVQLAAPRETENAARGAFDAASVAEAKATDASSSASTATLLGVVALLLGLSGLILGGLAFQRSGSKEWTKK